MHGRSPRSRGAVRPGALLGLLVLVIVIAAGVYYYACPCGRIPGGYLLGEEVAEPVADWSFANDVRLCQIEVGSALRHSVNLNCMSSNGELFLSCANCEGKRWSTMALDDPRGRIRIGGAVYPVTLSRVVDPSVLDEAWRARARKVGRPLDRPRAEGWWSFRVESR